MFDRHTETHRTIFSKHIRRTKRQNRMQRDFYREQKDRFARPNVHESKKKGLNAHEIWDYNEYAYVSYVRKASENAERFVFVRPQGDRHRQGSAARVLFFLDDRTRVSQRTARGYAGKKKDAVAMHHFASVEHTFYELEPFLRFQGLNKPKNVHECALANGNGIGPDGTLRAHERYLMICVSGLVEAMESGREENVRTAALHLYDLLAHELAHTMANHVMFRENDHGDFFVQCEQRVKGLLGNPNDFANDFLQSMR
jgi:hypothetical protein